MFTLTLEDVFKIIQWGSKYINIHTKGLNNLCFADYIILISSNIDELEAMLPDLEEASLAFDLHININKTKIMSSNNSAIKNTTNYIIESVEEYVLMTQYQASKKKISNNRDDKTKWSNLNDFRKSHLYFKRP